MCCVLSLGCYAGRLSECWFLASLAMLAAKDRHKSLIVTAPGSPAGKHTCKFFKQGKWVFVDVDDRIPCLAKDRTPCYGRNRDINEYWVAVVEKAYAKYHSCYEALIDGEVDYGLHDLTGGICI